MLIAPMQVPTLDTMISVFRLDLALKLLLAVLCGGAIGFERQIAGKPAGLRTNILICLGSALAMDVSMHLGDSFSGTRLGDPGRIAAQVVTGIGFIGAGTIMQSRGTITGLTSAATIWAVAMIGLATGSGFYIEALGTTAMVMVVLMGLGRLEHGLLRAHRSISASIRVKKGVTRDALEETMRAEGIVIVEAAMYDHRNDRVFEVRLRGPARQFAVAREALLEREDVLGVYLD
ncbi:MAG: MgtC/SapB family protein [Gemmatimonadetes bacterium]|nr:MgtC/SapB family protein [Gemmatimonadota bacterium]MBI3566734.1 MgtC/SapB family protein [Gemmatimonadota bacterium]